MITILDSPELLGLVLGDAGTLGGTFLDVADIEFYASIASARSYFHADMAFGAFYV